MPACNKDVFRDMDFIRQNPMLVTDVDKTEFEKEDQECHHNMNVWKMV